MAGPEGIPGGKHGAHIWGWMVPAELAWLHRAAKPMGRVVEIGCLHGRSAFALLSACDGPVYCIDPWDDVADHCYGSFLGNCGHFPNLHAVRGYSPAAAVEVPGDVDMTFIDGDHSREGITADIEEWLPRTRKLICGHDYTEGPPGGYPDVKAVVDEAFGDEVRVASGTAIWAVRL